RVFDDIDAALGFSISRLCFEGPEEQLKLTENTQPAILAVSAALHAVLEENAAARRDLVAGHSLGEYSAIVSVGGLTPADAAPIGTATAVRNALLRQVASPVRWVESVQKMIGMGVRRFVEVGPGNVLTGLIKRIDSSVELVNVSDVPSLERFLSSRA